MTRQDGEMARRRVTILGVAVLCLWGVAAPALAEATKVVPLMNAGESRMKRAVGVQPTDPEQFQRLLQKRNESEARVRARLGPHGVSQKALDAREERLKSGKRACADNPQELNVVLIRIAFQEDRSGDLTSITTDGNFLLDPDESIIFDPPPHDKAYFEAHLDGLARYWNSMSAGALTVNTQVLPEGDEDAYFLSDIADYGPGSGGFWTIDGLVSLVQDMILAADAGTMDDGSINLAEFDFDDPNTYVIFAHAGGDLQSNLVITPGEDGYSPNDIPTFFVQLGDDDRVPLESIDPDTGEPGLITECSVIPESTSQDGLIGSIAASLYHEFGHALGLPDLYSTFTGASTVGYWDLMDNGTNLTATVGVRVDGEDRVFSVLGLLPPGLSIWSKWYLGWVDDQLVGGREQTFPIAATHRQDDCRKSLRLDVSGDEFFLAESRWVPPFNEGWVLISDPDTGVVQYLGENTNDPEPPNTHLYDFFMPWHGGMFLWRIRQDRVEANVRTNTVQSLPHTLGVELIEADGIKDIGVLEFSTRGFFGSDNDAFRQGVLYVAGPDTVEAPTTRRNVSARTLPNTHSTFGFATGAFIEEIPAPSDTEIVVNAGIDGLVDLGTGTDPVWPVEISSGSEVPLRGVGSSLTVADFGTERLLLVEASQSDGTGSPGLYGFELDGTPAQGGGPLVTFSSPLIGPPALTEDFGDGLPTLVAATTDGTVHAFQYDGVTFSQDPEFPLSIGASIDVGPRLVGTGSASVVVLASLAEGELYTVTTSGSVTTSAFAFDQFALRSAPAQVWDGSAERIAFVAGGFLFVGTAGADHDAMTRVAMSENFDSLTDGEIFVLGWPDPDGAADRILVVGEEEDGTTFLMRAEFEGSQLVMRDFGRRLSSPPVSEPAIADLDGDGRLEVFVATERRLWSRNDLGVDVSGFPVRLEDRHLTRELQDERPLSNVLVADIDGDDLNEVVVGSTNGLLHALEYDGRNVAEWPRRVTGAGGTNLIADFPGTTSDQRALFSFEARGDSLDSGLVRAPRLVALDLGESPDATAGDRPAEWLSLGGGPARSQRAVTGSPSTVTGPANEIAMASPLVYPNPVRGRTTRVRFFSGAAHTALVTLYNLEGEFLRTAEQFNGAGVIGEVAMDISLLAPGPYLCRLEYTGRSGPTTEILTVYIE